MKRGPPGQGARPGLVTVGAVEGPCALLHPVHHRPWVEPVADDGRFLVVDAELEVVDDARGVVPFGLDGLAIDEG